MEPFLAPTTAERLRAAFGDADQEVLAIEARGSIAGMLRTDRTFWARHKALEVRTLLVDPRRRGEGLGVGALRALQERELARGTHRIQAEAYGFNRAGVRTFQAAGFAQEGVRRGAWWRHDEFQDGILLGWLAPTQD